MILSCGDRRLDLSRPVVMGILNVTRDSFSDGGRFLDSGAALAHASQMIAAGAAIIDIGGESTRPGAEPVPLQQELDRVVPLVEALRAGTDAVLSVDTMKPEVMTAAIAAGAGLVNDVRALQAKGAVEAVARSGAAVCLMHMQGEPRTMQHAPTYDDVVREVREFLVARAEVCIASGIARERIALDPGFGFGKTVAHNLALLAKLGSLVDVGYPVLAGLSRKSMLRTLLGRAEGERLAGSLALAAAALERGAAIVRAHDVAETMDLVRVLTAVRDAGEER
ncbi:dihydropteroate synthase [bacterium]|nr:MAG: dihydropteroate synthase [bacterium]